MANSLMKAAKKTMVKAYAETNRMYHIAVKKGEVGRYVFLPGDPFRTDLIASFLDDAKLVAHNREHKTWTGYLDGVKVSVTSTGMGCASTAIAVEELLMVGADTFIRIGTAGKVCEDAQNPDLDGCICTAAVRDEGTTIQYIPIEYPAVANRQVVEALAKAAKDNGKNYIEGITQSKDSFYGEVDPDRAPDGERLKQRWRAWEKGNVMASEMESAALFVISTIRGARASSIMDWKENMPGTIKVACDAVRELIKQDKENKES
jgi:uridine phosphorylase